VTSREAMRAAEIKATAKNTGKGFFEGLFEKKDSASFSEGGEIYR
jgi:hypothetical protein